VNAVLASGRPGVSRGLIELRQSFTGGGLVGHLLWPAVTLVVVLLLRDARYGETDLSLGGLMLPGVVGMFVALGMLLTIQYLAADREDGTLLRARATPGGIRTYILGKLITVSLTVLVYLAVLLVPGWFVVGGYELAGWFTLAWVAFLALLATQPIGIMLGALIASPRGAGYVSLPVMGLIAASGIFYPIGALPAWVQALAQAFPVYWIGLGMRSALLADEAAAIEIAGAWRQAETAIVLGAWAAAGLVLAPLILRRMARRESGSGVARRRDRLLQRVS
jgi:ABC-2 type transport system permease protein